MTLLGGVGTIVGPMVGAFTVITLHSRLSAMGSWVTVIIGMIFIVCVLVFRRGFIGELEELIRRQLKRPNKPTSGTAVEAAERRETHARHL
jgi:branched-chain amino acid transport system permease protein